jgi:hypothetical protein
LDSERKIMKGIVSTIALIAAASSASADPDNMLSLYVVEAIASAHSCTLSTDESVMQQYHINEMEMWSNMARGRSEALVAVEKITVEDFDLMLLMLETNIECQQAIEAGEKS